MIVENKKLDNVYGQEINSMTDEIISLLKKVIIMLAPISIPTTFGVKVEATGSSNMDGIGTLTSIGAGQTVATITSVNQLGGDGILSIPSFGVTIPNSIPIFGGFNYVIGEIVTLSGNGTIMINSLYDYNILAINRTPISGGTGYVGGEIITLGNGINGTVMVTSVDNSGVVLEVSIVDIGYDYYIGEALQVRTTGIGSGLSVNITSVVIGIGSVRTFSVLSTGSNYVVGNNYQQLSSTGIGVGLIVSFLNVDTGYGNNNFLQMDTNRWLFTEMIRNQIQF